MRHLLDALFGHAVDATEVATVGQRDAQVVDHPAVARIFQGPSPFSSEARNPRRDHEPTRVSRPFVGDYYTH